MIPFANFANFTTFATYRTADSLTLNDKTNSDLSTDVASDKQDHFAITTETVIVVAQMNDDNDEVKDIVPGSLNDIQVANSTNPKDSSTSAVFVLNAEDDDWGTVAKLVLVVNPEPTSEGGSSSVSGVSDFKPVTNNAGTADIRYYNVADADLINYIKNELAAYLGVSANDITYDAFNSKANVAGMSTPINVNLIEVFQVSDGVTTTYVDTGTTTVAPGADKLPAGNYLLDDVQADNTAITVNAVGAFSGLSPVTKDTDLVTAYTVTLGSNVAASATTEDGTSFSTGHYVADGVEVTVTSKAARTGLYALKITDADGNVTVGEPKNLSSKTANYNYVVRSAVTLDEAQVADVTILGRDYGYKAVGDTITFTSDAAASAIITKKGNIYATLVASVTATGTGFSYTVAVTEMHTDNTITLVEAYTVADQTANVGIFTDAGCTKAISNGAYYEAGTTLYVKADAGESLDAATIAKLTATSVNGVYSFEVENTVANNAFTVE